MNAEDTFPAAPRRVECCDRWPDCNHPDRYEDQATPLTSPTPDQETTMPEPRLFHLQRTTDVTGVSGTGRVADGVLWPDRTVSIRWRGDRPSTVFWDRLEDAEQVHGHGGATRIIWDDEPMAQRLARIAQAHTKHVDQHGGTSGDCTECEMPSPCATHVWATTDRDPLATWDPCDDEPETPEPDKVPCSAAALKRPHLPHSWQPQPGMRPVLCGGIYAPPAAQPDTGDGR